MFPNSTMDMSTHHFEAESILYKMKIAARWYLICTENWIQLKKKKLIFRWSSFFCKHLIYIYAHISQSSIVTQPPFDNYISTYKHVWSYNQPFIIIYWCHSIACWCVSRKNNIYFLYILDVTLMFIIVGQPPR